MIEQCSPYENNHLNHVKKKLIFNYPASENPNLVRCLLGGGQDDTVGRRYRRAEIERGEADAIQENGDPERMGYMNIELWNKPRFKYQ